MMANPWRGEVVLTLDGRELPMRLPLGILAELESELACGSLLGLVQRFEQGTFGAGDLMALLHAGLRGGGSEISRDDLGRARIGGGPVGAAQAAARLLRLTFALPEGGG